MSPLQAALYQFVALAGCVWLGWYEIGRNPLYPIVPGSVTLLMFVTLIGHSLGSVSARQGWLHTLWAVVILSLHILTRLWWLWRRRKVLPWVTRAYPDLLARTYLGETLSGEQWWHLVRQTDMGRVVAHWWSDGRTIQPPTPWGFDSNLYRKFTPTAHRRAQLAYQSALRYRRPVVVGELLPNGALPVTFTLPNGQTHTEVSKGGIP